MDGGGGLARFITNISKNTWAPLVQLQNTMTPQKQMLENHIPPPPKIKKKMQEWVQFLLFQCFSFGTCENLQTNSATKI